VDLVPDTAEEERMYLYTAEDFSGEELADCDEGILRWIPEEEILSLSLWEGDRIFLRLLKEGRSGFYLRLVYEGDALAGSQLDEHGAAGRLEE
jgi:8-oxo-dGTP diphosphatase